MLKFTEAASALTAQGFQLIRHFAHSGETLQKNALTQLDMVRVGGCLYGHYGAGAHPALHWYTRVLNVKVVPAGSNLGYNPRRLKSNVSIALVPLGYFHAPHLPKLVGINGQMYPILDGGYSMSLSMVDVSAGLVQEGDLVLLKGCCINGNFLRDPANAAQVPNTIPRFLIV